MKSQFWGGGDEISVLKLGNASVWDFAFDQKYNRPLVPLGAIVATHLTPDNVSGFLWLATALRFLSAALVYAIMGSLFRRNRELALAAAVLFIVNPS